MDLAEPRQQDAGEISSQDAQAILASASLKDPAIGAHPNAYYEAMRKDDPVHFDARLDAWLVSRYEDVRAVLADPITYSVEEGFKHIYAHGHFDEFKAILEKDGGGFFPDAIMTDPPYHTRIRKLMEHAFTAHRVKALEPRIAALIGKMVDGLVARGTVDGMKDFSVPITIQIICEQLGISQYDNDKISRWSMAVTAQISKMQDQARMAENARHICDLQNYLIERIKEREAEPQEDMISDLVHAKADDGTPNLDFKEVVSLVRAMLIAGNDTTATGLGNMLYLLATKDGLLEQLRESAEDDRKLSRWVEEMLRIEPPVRALSRATTRDAELAGAKIPKGAHMLLLYASANFDSAEFASPHDFDMTRGNLGKSVAFGGGVHRCIGIALARMEIKMAAREIARRVGRLELAVDPSEITFLPTVATRTMEKLPLKITPLNA